MKKTLLSTLAIILLVSSAFASEWKIDPDHSNAYFSIRHMMIADVHGMFPDVTGTVQIDEDDVTKSKVNVVIGIDSLNTGVDARDNHLRTNDFFDLEKFPVMKFKSREIKKIGEGAYVVIGDLTIRGFTNVISLDVTGPSDVIKDPWGNNRVGLKAFTSLNRFDYGVAWDGKMPDGSDMVGSDVSIVIDAELIEVKK